MNRLCVIPSPALKNQIARDLSHREAHRTFPKISNPCRASRASRVDVRARDWRSRPFRAFPKREIYSILAHLRARISPRSWPRLHLDPKTPLSDRVLAGSNLGCQRLLKKRFFCSRTTGQSLRVGFARCAADEGSEPITGALAWA